MAAETLDEDSEQFIGVKDKGPMKKVIMEKLATKAAGGDLRAIEMLMDRMDGKPRQSVDMNVEQWPVIKGVEIE